MNNKVGNDPERGNELPPLKGTPKIRSPAPETDDQYNSTQPLNATTQVLLDVTDRQDLMMTPSDITRKSKRPLAVKH